MMRSHMQQAAAVLEVDLRKQGNLCFGQQVLHMVHVCQQQLLNTSLKTFLTFCWPLHLASIHVVQEDTPSGIAYVA